MNYEIIEISKEKMPKYAAVPISFTVSRILEPAPIDNGLGGIGFIEKTVEPYMKDYDEHGSGTNSWHKRFDTSNWVRFAAVLDSGDFIGGATVAYKTNNVNMLEGRDDITVLWDIRVHPDYRGKGVGRMLFSNAIDWSMKKDCKMMKIETQNININACRFYSAMGCRLGGIRSHVYNDEGCKDELMMLWYYDLRGKEHQKET